MSIQSNEPGRFSGVFASFDSQPYLDMQHRTLEAVAKISNSVGHAAAEIGECQLEVLRSFASFTQPPAAQTPDQRKTFGGLWESQIENSRTFVETATEQMRHVNALLRDCTAELASEIEACTRDNFKTLGANMEKLRGQAERNVQSAAETMRSTTDKAADAVKKTSDVAAKAIRNAPAAE